MPTIRANTEETRQDSHTGAPKETSEAGSVAVGETSEQTSQQPNKPPKQPNKPPKQAVEDKPNSTQHQVRRYRFPNTPLNEARRNVQLGSDATGSGKSVVVPVHMNNMTEHVAEGMILCSWSPEIGPGSADRP